MVADLSLDDGTYLHLGYFDETSTAVSLSLTILQTINPRLVSLPPPICVIKIGITGPLTLMEMFAGLSALLSKVDTGELPNE